MGNSTWKIIKWQHLTFANTKHLVLFLVSELLHAGVDCGVGVGCKTYSVYMWK